MVTTEKVHESARGTLRIRVNDSGLLVAVVSGHYGADLLAPYLAAMEQVTRAGQAVGFHDWERMDSYDTRCRQDMTEWTIRNIGQIAGWHILVRSRLVAMGVATASLLIGKEVITSYTSRER